MIQLAPLFVLDDPVQGVKGWKVTLHDLPELTGSKKQINWATNIRTGSLHSFIATMLEQGGDSAIAHRHWWGADLQRDVRDVQRKLNDELVPMLTRATHSRDWITALDWDRNVRDAGVVARLLAEEKVG